MTDPIEAFLTRLQHPVMAGIDLKLDRMQRLLSLLGNPQNRLPPVIHVAGTNGKGSLIAYLHAIFETAGYRVHRYTSPHLVEFRERIVLQGKMVENAYLQPLLKHIASILPAQPATFFEATTALAFLAFAEKPADVLLLETGMGGRLDATNVIAKPLLTAITPISFDHCEYLGNDLTAIAGEKAGILKPGVVCVIGKQSPKPAQVITEKAVTVGAPLYRYGLEWHVKNYIYRSSKRSVELAPSLAGAHQYDNAATAVACIDQLTGFTITDAHIAQGISKARWPARLQRLDSHPYAQLLLPGMELWLDGGHNPQGGEVLAEWLAQRGLEAHLICGMMKGKDTEAFLTPLASYIQSLYTVSIPGEPISQTPEYIQAAALKLNIAAQSAASLENALQTIRERAKTPCIVCICGSLYLAGKVLAKKTDTRRAYDQ